MQNKYFLLSNYIKSINNRTNIITVKDYKKFNSGLILRHDVDFSLDLAYKFSRVEKENGILSTYYILLTSDLYNPFSVTSRKKIKTMIDEGFEIGLHFDPAVYGDIPETELEMKFLKEVKAFESAFDINLESYSLHNPSIHGKYPNFKGYINAYNPEIFSDECYMSDSMFSFRGKFPKEFIEKSKDQLIQYLTHPIQYFNDGKVSYEKQMNMIINNYYRKFDEMFRVNRIYNEQRNEYKIKINEEL